MKKILISVTSDLVTDQRVHKVSQSLCHAGYEVFLIGRRKKDSLPIEKREYGTRRMKLFFEKGPLFYAEYNVRLFFLLLFSKADALVANDLDTLLANYVVSIIKRLPLLYDSHEYFTGVPELLGRPNVRKIWKRIEKFIFPKLKYIYTVNDSIKKMYEREYKVSVEVARNFPVRQSHTSLISIPNLPEKFIIYQGALNKDRGLEEMIDAMQYLNDIQLLIVGTGDIEIELHIKVANGDLYQKVYFTGAVPFENLSTYTNSASLGLSLEKDTNINYRYSLPNKVADYIQAGVPVLCSRLVEIEKIINKYNVGLFIDSHEPVHIASRIKLALEDEELRAVWKKNLPIAASELCWQNEEKILLSLVKRALG